MNYSIISVIGMTKLNSMITEYMAQFDKYSLVFHSQNSVPAASIIDSISVQIIILQEELSFYSENWFIRDTHLHNPNLKYIVLKSKEKPSKLSVENKNIVTAILDWETLTLENLEKALDTAAFEYEQERLRQHWELDDSQWQNYYMEWIQKSNILAGVLNKTLDAQKLNWRESPNHFILVIAENASQTDWTFYTQSSALLGKLYYRLNVLMERMNGTVFISGEKKLCFLIGAVLNNYESKLSILQQELNILRNELSLPVLQLAASGVISDFSQIPELYRNIDGILRYHFFTNQNLIITEQWLTECSVKLVFADFHMQINQLNLSFEHQNYSDLSNALSAIKNMTLNTLSFNSYSYVWGQLCFFYFFQAQKYNLPTEPAFSSMDSHTYKSLESSFSKLAEYIISLFKILPKQKTISSNNPHIKKAAEYIQQNISQKLSLTDVSSAVHVSPSYLSHLFQKELGTTYIDYTNHLRIKHAARLLMEPSKITQVAVLSGFTDSKYFSKVFKQIMGESPKEYQLRVMRRENH